MTRKETCRSNRSESESGGEERSFWQGAPRRLCLFSRRLNGWEKNGWFKEYVAGLMLLDAEDPQKVIGLAPEPLIRAEAKYELEGFRGSVIFPGGMILEESGEVKIYYGGADTVECLATASLEDLLAMIQPVTFSH